MNKKIIILSSFCLVLLCTWVIGLFTAPEVQARRRKETPLIASLQRADISALDIGAVSLNKTDTSWMLDGIPAREDRVVQFLDSLESANNKGAVGSNDDSYGFSEERTIRVVSSGKTTTISLGDTIAGGGYLYAILNDEDPVLQTADALDFYFRQNESYWRDLRLYPENIRPNEEDVVQITFMENGTQYTLSRTLEDGLAGWVLDGTEAADSDLADAFVRTFFNLEANEVYPLAAVAVGEAVAEVKVQVQNDASYVTTVYAGENSESFFAHPEGLRSNYYFELKEAIKDRLIRERSYFSSSADDSAE